MYNREIADVLVNKKTLHKLRLKFSNLQNLIGVFSFNSVGLIEYTDSTAVGFSK